MTGPPPPPSDFILLISRDEESFKNMSMAVAARYPVQSRRKVVPLVRSKSLVVKQKSKIAKKRVTFGRSSTFKIHQWNYLGERSPELHIYQDLCV